MRHQSGEEDVGVPEAVEGAEAAPDLEAVMHLMWDRIEAAEARWRRMRDLMGVGVMVAAIALVALVVEPRRVSRDGGALVLRDLAGRVRARLEIEPEGERVVLRMFDPNGVERVALASSSDGPALTFASGGLRRELRFGAAEAASAHDTASRAERERPLPCASCRAPDAVPLEDPQPRHAPAGTLTGLERGGAPPADGASRERPRSEWAERVPRHEAGPGGPCLVGTLGCDRAS